MNHIHTCKVDEAASGKVAQMVVHLCRALIILAHGVRQASVGVGADVAVGDVSQALQVGPHLRSPQRTVQPNGERLAVLHASVKRLRGLTREGAAASVGDGSGDDEREAGAEFGLGVELIDGVQGSLGIQGVKNSLHH